MGSSCEAAPEGRREAYFLYVERRRPALTNQMGLIEPPGDEEELSDANGY